MTKSPSKPKPKRDLHTIEFDKPHVKTLALLIRKTGWTKKTVVQRALDVAATSPQFFNLIWKLNLEQNMTQCFRLTGRLAGGQWLPEMAVMAWWSGGCGGMGK
jgi:hypothetical protein